MNVSTNVFAMLSIICLLFIAGCSSSEGADQEDKPNDESMKEEQVTPEIPSIESEPAYKETVDTLTSKGFTLGEIEAGENELFNAESGMTIAINDEQLMPLHIYKLSSDDPRISKAQQTGSLEVAKQLKREQISVLVKDPYVFYLHRGHPDYEQIIETLN